MNTIVVPLDMSPFGEHALPLARTIACHAPAGRQPTLHLVHVHVPVYRAALGDAMVGAVPVVDERADAECCRTESQYLQALSARLQAGTGLHVVWSVLHGPVPPSVAQHALKIGADMIVMTTHGRGGVARMWLGNVADALLRHGGVPVVVVRPPAAPPTLEPAPAIKRILIPLDGSPLAEQVLEPACAIGDQFGASYRLLHVFTAFPAGGYAPGVDAATLRRIEQRARADMQTYLHDVAEQLRAAGRDVAIEVCGEEQPARAIVETTRQRGVDLLALATHGRGGVRRWLLGSVADKVVRAAHTPVLLYHPQAHEHGRR